ncbi:GNAT family N-acetyltransferase [soil metagenome]
MSAVHITPLTEELFVDFLALMDALADYEKLDRPSAEARERLRSDAFRERPRYQAFLAIVHDSAVGYAICFETYSSFLARPSMYLEDLFVLEGARKQGAGLALFNHVRALAQERTCGRMEWHVLDWNMLARDFYQRNNAQHMNEWLMYRITF